MAAHVELEILVITLWANALGVSAQSSGNGGGKSLVNKITNSY